MGYKFIPQGYEGSYGRKVFWNKSRRFFSTEKEILRILFILSTSLVEVMRIYGLDFFGIDKWVNCQIRERLPPLCHWYLMEYLKLIDFHVDIQNLVFVYSESVSVTVLLSSTCLTVTHWECLRVPRKLFTAS